MRLVRRVRRAQLSSSASERRTRRSSFSAASELINSIAKLCDALDHHPTITINEAKVCERVGGCGVAIEFTTFSAGGAVTARDYGAAAEVEDLITEATS